MSSHSLSTAFLTTLPVGLYFIFLAGSAPAQSNPCDLNKNGVVNFADVLDAVEMMKGGLACTADILGVNVCNHAVVERVQGATRTGVCITGTPSGPRLYGLSLSPSVIVTGQSGTGTLTLNEAAGTGGVVVTLSSSSSALKLPASVAIAQGATSANFVVQGGRVTAATAAIVTGVYSGVWATSDVTVDSATALTLSSFTVNPSLLLGGQAGTGTVELTADAPAGGALIALSSANAAISLPATVTVPAGSSSVNFNVTAGTVTSSTQVALTASYGGGTENITVTVERPTVVLSWVSSTSPNIAGYNVYRGTVTGGPYSKLNATVVPQISYADDTIQSGFSYFYVTTTVNTTGEQSTYSNEAEVAVP